MVACTIAFVLARILKKIKNKIMRNVSISQMGFQPLQVGNLHQQHAQGSQFRLRALHSVWGSSKNAFPLRAGLAFFLVELLGLVKQNQNVLTV